MISPFSLVMRSGVPFFWLELGASIFCSFLFVCFRFPGSEFGGFIFVLCLPVGRQLQHCHGSRVCQFITQPIAFEEIYDWIPSHLIDWLTLKFIYQWIATHRLVAKFHQEVRAIIWSWTRYLKYNKILEMKRERERERKNNSNKNAKATFFNCQVAFHLIETFGNNKQPSPPPHPGYWVK